ncbi:MAG: peptidase M61 [Bacteroidetes bacterium]|nr:peptidase M61 [Bacteroidota bacterium]MBP6640278.1 peptidase M61 [Bacteroidia bacterium]
MKNRAFALLLAGFAFCSNLWAQKDYSYSLDLSQVVEDRVQVTLTPPAVATDQIEFQMPKIVPGTYSISDFGRFITGFEATDESGTPLPVDYIDQNRWLIRNAKSMKKISYWVEDTWDSKATPRIFEPAGTNIEVNNNFVVNPFGFFGYLEGMKEMPFKLTVKKPSGFYGSTALVATKSGDTEDVFEVNDYHRLADSPIMYCKPDTAWENVGGAKVLVSVYSPNKKVSAKAIMAEISEIMTAQKEYLGGKLPVEKYAFIVYLTAGFGGSGGMGALEHSYSSMYYLPETSESQAGETMRDVAAHEFFHIVTPLSIHSEEIQYFDYIDPKMSMHLWLYEGLTEYAAGHVQVKQGLISKDQYFRMISQKITMANFMNDSVPFTEISLGCLDKYKSQYLNVYQKGALIGMCLDIQLRKLSGGKMGTQELMRELAKSYGKDRPFKDSELFDKITALTYPEIGVFFKKYVSGSASLPYADILAMAGLRYEPLANREILTLGKAEVKPNRASNRLMVTNIDGMNKFGETLGYMVGDEIVSFDDQPITLENADEVFSNFQANRKEGYKVKVVVARPDGKGGFAEKTLKAKAIAVKLKGMNLVTIDPKATPEQVAVRRSWLGQ